MKRLAYSNYFVARTGLNGDHRVCMVDVKTNQTLKLDNEFTDEVTRRDLHRLRPGDLAARRLGSGQAALDAVRHRRRRRQVSSDAPPPLGGTVTHRPARRGGRRRLVTVGLAGSSRPGWSARRRTPRRRTTRTAAPHPGRPAAGLAGPRPAACRCSAATRDPGVPERAAASATTTSTSPSPSRPPGPGRTWSGSTRRIRDGELVVHGAHGARASTRCYVGTSADFEAGTQVARRAAARRQRAVGRGRPARGQRHRPGHATGRGTGCRSRSTPAATDRRPPALDRCRRPGVPDRRHRGGARRRYAARRLPRRRAGRRRPRPRSRRSSTRWSTAGSRRSPSSTTTRPAASRRTTSSEEVAGRGRRVRRGARTTAPGERNALLVVSGWADAASSLATVTRTPLRAAADPLGRHLARAVAADPGGRRLDRRRGAARSTSTSVTRPRRSSARPWRRSSRASRRRRRGTTPGAPPAAATPRPAHAVRRVACGLHARPGGPRRPRVRGRLVPGRHRHSGRPRS